MSGAAHTAEPWAIEIDPMSSVDARTLVIPAGGDIGGKWVAMTWPKDAEEPDDQESCSLLEAEANARRIVAAINACAGLSTEALEEAASFADAWHRLGCLRDLCEIERAVVSREPRPR